MVLLRLTVVSANLLTSEQAEQCATATPFESNLKLTKIDSETATLQMKETNPNFSHFKYIGILNWLNSTTRFDIAIATTFIAAHCAAFGTEHYKALARAFGYLKLYPGNILRFGRKQTETFIANGKSRLIVGERPIECYADASFANDPFGKQGKGSVLGHVLFVFGSPIVWYARRCKSTVLNTTEAELMSMAETIKTASWARNLYEEIFASSAGKIPLAEDNNGAEINSKGPVRWSTSRHFSINIQYVREEIRGGMVDVYHCPTSHMLADFFTKALPKATFFEHLHRMMIVKRAENITAPG